MQNGSIQFIGLGGAISGCGFLYTYVHSHPETCLPKVATHFFSDANRFARGTGWYEAHFAQCKEGMVRGEAAYDYLACAEASTRIARTYSRARLLAVVSNPVENVYRTYSRAKEAGDVPPTLDFASYLERYPDVLEHGLFGRQLAAYFELYSPVNLLVSVHEDRYDDPIAYIQTVYRFLELDDTFVPKALRPFQTIDPHNPPPRPWYVRLLRLALFPIWLLRLNRLAAWVWKHVQPYAQRWLTPRPTSGPGSKPAGPQPAPIPAELRRALNDYYRADVQVLSRLLDRNLVAEWHMEADKESSL